MRLRPYQSKAISEVRSLWPGSVVLCMATGSGKTVVAAEIIRLARSKGKRVLFLVHRRELVYQAQGHIGDCGLLLAGEKETVNDVQVASIQTLVRRELPPADIVIVDEAHRAVGASYLKVLAHYDYVLGLTATPIRLDGKGLGAVFSSIIEPVTTKQLIEQGHLAAYDYYAPSEPDMVGARKNAGDWTKGDATERMEKPKIVGSILEHYEKYGRGTTTLVFAPSVTYSKQLASLLGGEHVDAKTPPNERARIFECLREGTIPLVSNVEIVTEGFDAPDVGCVILARPTDSLGLHRQMIGRALRPGKRAVILDHAGNVYRHGLPCEDIPWSLEDTKLEPRKRQIRTCAKCFAIFDHKLKTCPLCGANPKPERRPRKGPGSRGGKLEKFTGRVKPGVTMPAYLHNEYVALATKARDFGYKPGWAKMQFKSKFGRWPYGIGPIDDKLKADCPHTKMEKGRCRFCRSRAGGQLTTDRAADLFK